MNGFVPYYYNEELANAISLQIDKTKTNFAASHQINIGVLISLQLIQYFFLIWLLLTKLIGQPIASRLNTINTKDMLAGYEVEVHSSML